MYLLYFKCTYLFLYWNKPWNMISGSLYFLFCFVFLRFSFICFCIFDLWFDLIYWKNFVSFYCFYFVLFYFLNFLVFVIYYLLQFFFSVFSYLVFIRCFIFCLALFAIFFLFLYYFFLLFIFIWQCVANIPLTLGAPTLHCRHEELQSKYT